MHDVYVGCGGAGEPRGGDGSRSGEVRQVRRHRAAEHRRGAHPRPARAGRRGALGLRLHSQVCTYIPLNSRSIQLNTLLHLHKVLQSEVGSSGSK